LFKKAGLEDSILEDKLVYDYLNVQFGSLGNIGDYHLVKV